MSIPFTKTTIYIPNHNSELYINQTLNSVLNQDWPNLEILISDDASTDGSLDIIKSRVKDDDRVKLFEWDRPHGIGGNINEVMKEATGEFGCICDSDDMLMERYWDTFLPYFAHSRVGFVSIGLISIGKMDLNKILYNYIPPRPWKERKDIIRFPMVFSSSPWRMEMFKDIGGYDSGEILVDWEFWIKAIVNGWEFSLTLHPGYFYRLRDSSISNTTSQDRVNERTVFLRDKYTDLITTSS